MTRNCFIDTETRCAVPIHHGTDLYARAAECIIVTWALDNEPVKIWDRLANPTMPDELQEILGDWTINLIAHQAPFDRAILNYALKFPTHIARWRCTRAQAYAHGLPGALELLGLVLGIGEEHQKQAEAGAKLIQVFCVPDKTGKYIQPNDAPEKWEEFKGYAIRDTDALREIYRKLPNHNYRGDNLVLWHLDQLINERGFRIDAPFARTAVKFLAQAKELSDTQLAVRTEGAVTSATQRTRLLEFLQNKWAPELQNLTASTVRSLLETDDLHPEMRFLLERRLEAGKSSGSKYKRGLQTMGPGDRICHGLQYGGAGRTGRWSGKGFQVHNMARPVLNVRRPDGRMRLLNVEADYIDQVIMPGIVNGKALTNPEVYGGPNEAAALALRHVIVAAPGNELIVADYSNIESRILAWIAGEEWKLAVYREIDGGAKLDTYKILFSQFFGTPVELVNETERQSGKVCDLSFGFHGGVGALVTMSASYQMDLDILPALVLPRARAEHVSKADRAWRIAFLKGEDYALEPAVYRACDILKQVYRAKNERIDQLFYEIDHATKECCATPDVVKEVGRCKIWVTAKKGTNTWLVIQLPSGRRLLYANPSIKKTTTTHPLTGEKEYRSAVTYATARGKTWRREAAWAGLFLENIVQGIANDVLREGLMNVAYDTKDIMANRDTTAIALHVHDEIGLEMPIGTYTVEKLVAAMTRTPSWGEGLPLAAKGWKGPRYGKR